jgi:hypothetical protein
MTIFRIANTGNYYVEKNTGSFNEEFGAFSNSYSAYCNTNGQSCYYYGASQLPTAPNSSWTLEAIFYIESFLASGNPYVVDFGNLSASTGMSISWNGTTKLARGFSGTVQCLTSATALVTGKWYHIAIVKNLAAVSGEHNLKMYINGVLEASNNDPTATYAAMPSGRPMLGSSGNSLPPVPPNQFNGWINSVRLSYSALYKCNSLTASIPSTMGARNKVQFPFPKFDLPLLPTTQFLFDGRTATNLVTGTKMTPIGSPNPVVTNNNNPYSTSFTNSSNAALRYFSNSNLAALTLNEIDLTSAYQGSLSFNGTNQYIVYSNSTTTAAGSGFNYDDFTVECWVNFSSVTNTQRCIFGAVGNTNSTSCWEIRTGTPGSSWQLVMYDSTTLTSYANTNAVFSTGVWYHLAACRSANVFYGYMNGTKAFDGVSAFSFNMAGRAAISIGGFSNGISTSLISGSVTNARIVKGRAIYPNQATITVPDSPLQIVPGTTFLASMNYLSTNASLSYIDSGPHIHLPGGTLGTPSTAKPTWTTTPKHRITNEGNLIINGVFDEITTTANTYSVSFGGAGALKINYNADKQYPHTFDYASSGILAGKLPYTFECWINLTALPSATTATYTLLDFRNASSTTQPYFEINSSNQLTAYGSTRTIATPTAIASAGTWYHICIQRHIDYTTSVAAGVGYSIQYVDMFINGVRTYTAGNATEDTTAFGSGSVDPAFIGSNYLGANFFNGYISNLRFTPGVALYANSGFTPSTSALSATRATTILMCNTPQLEEHSANRYTITTSGTAPTVSNTAPF